MRAPARLRCFGVLAHVDAGKTTLSERLLFVAGRSHALGEVHDGRAQLDHLTQERTRGITITAAATDLDWDGHVLTLVDTPGHVDFTAEVERSLRVLDGAVIVLDAVAGVEPQTEAVWLRADAHGLPRIVVINKLDRLGANPAAAVTQLRARFEANAVPVDLPVGTEGGFRGLVDLVTRYQRTWTDPADPRVSLVAPVEPGLVDEVERNRRHLIEAVAAADEQLLFDEDGLADPAAVTAPALTAAIGRATRAGLLVPVLHAAALANVGVQPVLDAVVAWLPSPLDRPVERGAVAPEGPFVGLVAKVTWEQNTRTVWLRILGGHLTVGDKVLNPATGTTERVSRLLRLHAGTPNALDSAGPGEIVAALGLDTATTGHTLCAPDHPVELTRPTFPRPLVTLAVEATTRGDQDRLGRALSRLVDEDPTLDTRVDPRTGQILLAGLGSLHLEVAIERLRTDHATSVRTGTPVVARRATIARAVSGHEQRHIRQRGGPGQFAVITIDVQPTGETELGSLTFTDATTGGILPAGYLAAIQAGINDTMGAGTPASWPLVGLAVTVTDAKTHPNDSNEHAFRAAGAAALRAVLAAAGDLELEPIIDVEVTCPPYDVGTVIGLLRARQADISSVHRARVHATLGLQAALDLTEALRNATHGRAAHTTADAGYRTAR